jgi:hypothetical protein
VITPFGVPWEDLTLRQVTAFFAEPREEAQTWDAKGTTITAEQVRKSVCGFANSVLGGFVVLGVSQLDKKLGTWAVEGWEPRDEAQQWVTDCIRGGMDPIPAFDVCPFKLDPLKSVVVVRVWPVAVPPCVTVEGYMYERVGTSTAQVRDSAALHRLFERGAEAERRAREVSIEGRTDFGSKPLERDHQVVLALASPSLRTDIPNLAFRKSVADTAATQIAGLPHEAPRPEFIERLTRVDQHCLTVATESRVAGRDGYTVRIRDRGSVAVGYANPEIASGLVWIEDAAKRFAALWGVAGAVLSSMDAIGPAYLAVRLSDDKFGSVESEWWTSVDVSGDTIEAIVRQARRTRGKWDWEPE